MEHYCLFNVTETRNVDSSENIFDSEKIHGYPRDAAYQLEIRNVSNNHSDLTNVEICRLKVIILHEVV